MLVPSAGGGGGSFKFTPSAWAEQAKKINDAADSYYQQAEPVILSQAITARTDSPLERAAVAGDENFHNPWHRLIGASFEAVTALASKMEATGTDYAATEEAATEAAERFWK